MKTTTPETTATSLSGLRRTLCVGAVLACLPYLALKAIWLLGGRVGLLDPEFGTSATMHVANALTFAMEAVALTLAVAFVAPWGRRLPAPLVLLPMWIGTGLLGGILFALGFTAFTQVLGTPAAPSSPSPGAPGSPQAAIAQWVFVVVYAGFSVLGLCLLGGFALYAAERWLRPGGWGRRLDTWPAGGATSTRRWELLAGPTVVFGVGVLVAGFAGRTSGLDWSLADGTLTIAAGLGLMALAGGRPGGLPGLVPTVGVWVGSGALTAWGAYHFVLLAVPNDLTGGAALDASGLLLQGARIALGGALAAGLWSVRPQVGLRPYRSAGQPQAFAVEAQSLPLL
ncbi:MAG: hypothetical protein Q4P32_10945 [Micrococcales bacterium]|nr:hypothetical protein [Micrococcales bacterium]